MGSGASAEYIKGASDEQLQAVLNELSPEDIKKLKASVAAATTKAGEEAASNAAATEPVTELAPAAAAEAAPADSMATLVEAVDKNEIQALHVVVKVVSAGGEPLLDAVSLELGTSIEQLAERCAAKLGAPLCKLISPAGVELSKASSFEACGLSDGDEITAVAIASDTLLQLVGLQDLDGTAMAGSDVVPAKELERVALEVAKQLVATACWFGGAGHLEGYPTIAWIWGDVVPAPSRVFSSSDRFSRGSAAIEVRHHTPVVHAGAKFVVSTAKGSPGWEAEPLVKLLTKPMTLQELVDIRTNRPALSAAHSELLASNTGSNMVEPTMQLHRHSREEVHVLLGHRVYNDDVDEYGDYVEGYTGPVSVP